MFSRIKGKVEWNMWRDLIHVSIDNLHTTQKKPVRISYEVRHHSFIKRTVKVHFMRYIDCEF